MDKAIKKIKSERKILAGYIISFVVLFGIYLLSLVQNRQLTKLTDSVDHTTDIITRLESIGSTLKDAETGVRGYAITKNRDFLVPYYGTREVADSLYTSLLQLTSDNAVQQMRLARLKKNIDSRFEILDFFLKDFESNGNTITDTIIKIQPQSKELMTSIRSTITQMQQEENGLLKTRRDSLETKFKVLNIISFVALVLSLFLAVFVIATYTRSIKDRKSSLLRIKEYQDQLTGNIDELNKANSLLLKMRSQEKFAATGRIARTIAHEVRNPLTNINLATEQLKGEIKGDEENTTMLFEMIERNSSRINQLISDLLNSTKFSELNFQKIPVNELLEEALTEAQDRIAFTNIDVIRKFGHGTCSISVDKDRMKIAFLNIIINALEAMEHQEKGRLTIETMTENEKCKILISDNGPGMDSESISRLFEPYFTSKPKGNGLGLTNTQNIILNHKGEISVDSTVDKGTSFTIIVEVAE